MATGLRVSLTVDTKYATAWVRACKWLALVIPSDRLYRIAEWGAERLIRFRMDDGPWRWGVRPTEAAI